MSKETRACFSFQAMFIRVKRKKTTFFLHCEPSETILEIKSKLQVLTDHDVDIQRLILLSRLQPLEDAKTLADHQVTIVVQFPGVLELVLLSIMHCRNALQHVFNNYMLHHSQMPCVWSIINVY